MGSSVKRTYVSPKRAAQARATRAAIIGAAVRLFSANGYVATTIQAVADEAEVAVQTVYAVFGNKRELLRQALEAAVTGDPSIEALADQPAVQALRAEPDPRRRAELDAAMVAEISPRIAPLMKVIREAAAADPEFSATAAALVARRRLDMEAAAELLTGAVPSPTEREAVIGTLYVLYSPDVFLALTEDLGWSIEQYERWIADVLLRTVLSPR